MGRERVWWEGEGLSVLLMVQYGARCIGAWGEGSDDVTAFDEVALLLTQLFSDGGTLRIAGRTRLKYITTI